MREAKPARLGSLKNETQMHAQKIGSAPSARAGYFFTSRPGALVDRLAARWADVEVLVFVDRLRSSRASGDRFIVCYLDDRLPHHQPRSLSF